VIDALGEVGTIAAEAAHDAFDAFGAEARIRRRRWYESDQLQ
jgi:hypothetical protein